MEATDALAVMLTDLLIENSVMKRLLRDATPKLDLILRSAKTDQQRRQKVEEELIIPLRRALANEADLEQMMQRIAESSNNEKPA
ncbi:MAG: hypothetical protein WBW31_02595 [Candidatus Sulfotelmatobacter sp.]